MQIETLDSRSMTDDDARAIAQLLVRVWPESEKKVEDRQRILLERGRTYRGLDSQAPRCFVLRDADRVIAHSTFVTRTIGTMAGPLTVAGLSLVCSDPDYRGQGLGEAIVRPVFDLIDNKAFLFSLFQTSHEVLPFYERMGAVAVDNPIVNSIAEEPRASPFPHPVVMRYHGGEGWPEGEIDLCGPAY